MKILVLGVSGMLGNAAFRVLRDEFGFDVHGTARSDAVRRYFPADAQDRIHTGIDVTDGDALIGALARVRPDVVVNCIGVVKQLAAANDPLVTVPINTLLPHRLARAAELAGARLVHVSTDCVFNGKGGGLYTEASPPDAEDLYGRSKLLGEVDYPNAVTLRTSIIGRELNSSHALVDWLLSQTGRVRGFTRAVFSGLTTDELTRVIASHVLPRPELRGVWHVSAAPIAKHDLLDIIRSVYGLSIEIDPDPSVVIDRSLDSSRFRAATGYTPPDWPAMIARMRQCEASR
ncbi:dTDP-4-dehydrorhamnose reductase family protein [Azospirillum isscasi]|uniref:dTDP-4-dehydrorhamnose reductase n=1 Tax=Azospirillum isscasi TaxID=3053926 RepID=A0ABU0WPH8_9PROT|nr:SDR family oxidoreductase [Azospirillum isscasi]MDQ2104724.1 SDR family oxidoreductase [Azospirillum isscasi]